MSQEQLTAFVQRAQSDAGLLNALSQANEVETVAAIARGAGFTVSVADLWAASDLEPEMLQESATVWLDPHQSLTAFLHQVEVDPWYQEALIQAPDGETVAAIARAAGYPLTAEELWMASELEPDGLEDLPVIWQDPHGELSAFLAQAQIDGALQAALSQALDVASVAAIARDAGYAVASEDIWAASDLSPDDLESQAWPDDSSALGTEASPAQRPFSEPV
jgi:predicted ribosomally synthesized peptide with nif11-like leader